MEDPLKRRIRQMVMYCLNCQKTLNMSLPGLNKVFDKKCSLLIRFTWLFLVLTCLSLSLYQIAERWTYYRSEPISVDVDVKECDVMQFPVIALCSHNAEEIYNMFNEFGTLGHDKLVIETLIVYSNLSVMEMWEIANTKLVLSSAYIGEDKSVKVEWNEIITIEGTCLEFIIRKPMKYSSANQFLVNLRFKEHVTMYMFDKLMISDQPYPYHSASARATLGSLKKTFKLSFQKFSHLSTRKHPCFKKEEFMQCRQRCINSKIKKLDNCWFPFLKKETYMPPCQEKGNKLYKMYQIASNVQEKTDPISECGCAKPCFKTYINVQSHVEERMLNKTVYSFSFATNTVTVIQERFIYSFIALLCDVGGMLGLYLGVSLLSIWEMLAVSALYKRESSKTSGFADTDPIFNKVRSMIVKCSSTFPRHSSVVGNIMLLIKTLCVALSAWFVLIHTRKLLQAPTENTVSFEHNTHVRYPSLILCQLAQSVREKMSTFARKHKLKNWCDVEYLDLLDLPGVSVAWLWKNTSFRNDLMEFNKFFGQTTMDYDMPDGRCYKIESVEVKYAESYLTYLLIAYQLNFDPCNRDFIKVYVVNPGQRYDLFHYRNVPGRKGSEFRFQLKLVDVTEVDPDCDDRTAEICKQNCREKSIKGKLTCRLPFIPSSDQLPTCNTTTKAKEAKDIYTESQLGNIDNSCRCPRPCKTQIYETELMTEPLPGDDMPVTIVVFYFSSAATKSIIARFSYQFLKYLCEIGSFLGLFLGLSILSVCELLESVFAGGYKKYQMRSKVRKNDLSARIKKLATYVEIKH